MAADQDLLKLAEELSHETPYSTLVIQGILVTYKLTKDEFLSASRMAAEHGLSLGWVAKLYHAIKTGKKEL